MANIQALRDIELRDPGEERVALACIFKKPEIIASLESWALKPEIFSYPEHRTIFSTFISIYNEKGSIDPYLVTSKLKSFGVNTFQGVPIHDYVEAISATTCDPANAGDYFKEVCKAYVSRNIEKKLSESWADLKKNYKSRSFEETLNFWESTKTDIATISVSSHDSEFVDLFGTTEETIKKIADSGEIPGVWGPYKTFNDAFGPMTFGDSFIFAARSKIGKSTVIADMATHFAKDGKGNNIILMIDTELESFRVQTRNMSAVTGVNEFYFRNGGFKDDKVMVAKAEKAFEEMRNLKELVYHIYSADKPIDEVVTLVKRFHARHVKPGQNFICFYDYLKQTGETSTDMPEWRLIGDKANALKKLASALSRTVVITSIQLNEEDQVAMSSRVKWTTSGLHLLKKKTPEQLSLHGLEYGTHYFELMVTRSQGEHFEEFVAVSQGAETKYIRNNINLNISNFRVEDKGDYKKMIKELTVKGKQLKLAPAKESKYKKAIESSF